MNIVRFIWSMLYRMKVAVDLDGPVAEFDKSYIKYCNVRFGHDIPFDIQDKWALHETDGVNLTLEQDQLAFEEFCNIRMFAALDLVEGAKEGLCTLSGMGCDIVYITARPKSAHRTTAKWIVKQGLPLNGLIFSEDNKGEMAKLLGCKIAIDDKEENCLDFDANGLKTIIWSKKYNSSLPETDKMKRISNWKDIVRFISSEV